MVAQTRKLSKLTNCAEEVWDGDKLIHLFDTGALLGVNDQGACGQLLVASSTANLLLSVCGEKDHINYSRQPRLVAGRSDQLLFDASSVPQLVLACPRVHIEGVLAWHRTRQPAPCRSFPKNCQLRC